MKKSMPESQEMHAAGAMGATHVDEGEGNNEESRGVVPEGGWRVKLARREANRVWSDLSDREIDFVYKEFWRIRDHLTEARDSLEAIDNPTRLAKDDKYQLIDLLQELIAKLDSVSPGSQHLGPVSFRSADKVETP
jgi:hypothetical protein